MADLGALQSRLRGLGSVVVAFSGGADSAFLAYMAHEALGAEHAHAVTAVSASLATSERDECARLAAAWGLRWTRVDTAELSDPRYVANGGDRCAWCKTALMDALEPLRGDGVIVLGVNVDDLADPHRPGQAAAAARGAAFPLADAGFTKADVRSWSRHLGLQTWDKPAAPCLSSRVPYGTPVRVDVLSRVERAERAVRALGFADLRIRHLGDAARLEVPLSDVPRAFATEHELTAAVVAAGYHRLVIDPAGLRSGNLNAALGHA